MSMMESFKIFVLPPLLALAVVALSLMTLMDYLTQRSLRTTYVISSLKRNRLCSLCHDGTFTRIPVRVAAVCGGVIGRN
jgi:hypothetical protein